MLKAEQLLTDCAFSNVYSHERDTRYVNLNIKHHQSISYVLHEKMPLGNAYFNIFIFLYFHILCCSQNIHQTVDSTRYHKYQDHKKKKQTRKNRPTKQIKSIRIEYD